MGGKRRLLGGLPRLLSRHDGPDGRLYRDVFAALEADLGPFVSVLLRLEAGRAAVAWVHLQAASQALAAARRERTHGKGRRPSAREVERLARRHGLADLTYSAAVARLREQAATHRPAPTLAELVEQAEKDHT